MAEEQDFPPHYHGLVFGTSLLLAGNSDDEDSLSSEALPALFARIDIDTDNNNGDTNNPDFNSIPDLIVPSVENINNNNNNNNNKDNHKFNKDNRDSIPDLSLHNVLHGKETRGNDHKSFHDGPLESPKKHIQVGEDAMSNFLHHKYSPRCQRVLMNESLDKEMTDHEIFTIGAEPMGLQDGDDRMDCYLLAYLNKPPGKMRCLEEVD